MRVLVCDEKRGRERTGRKLTLIIQAVGLAELLSLLDKIMSGEAGERVFEFSGELGDALELGVKGRRRELGRGVSAVRFLRVQIGR